MRRKTSSGALETFINLDSFMDIVTNLIGALFFVVLYCAINSFNATSRISTPISKPQNTDSVIFECRTQQLIYPGIDELGKEVSTIWDESEKEGISNFRDVLKIIEDRKVQNDYYRFTYETIPYISGNYIYYRLSSVYTPIESGEGETLEELQDEKSLYRQELEKIDPAKNHVILFVRDDSFEIFHAARKIALKMGFRVGWEPMEKNQPIKFSSEGRSINPQS